MPHSLKTPFMWFIFKYRKIYDLKDIIIPKVDTVNLFCINIIHIDIIYNTSIYKGSISIWTIRYKLLPL